MKPVVSINRFLPGHAGPATARCEALGTMYPLIYSVRQPARESGIYQHKGGEGLGTSGYDQHM